ncbi:hypothetical protein ACH5RR_019404 [Cinchona calisaya]|uniref:Ferritin n=1 Tax=Cinchona calisaya TaxID=153742 RepID=A0ABD2ZP89_9GENT
MMLKATAPFTLSNPPPKGENLGPLFSSPLRIRHGFVVYAKKEKEKEKESSNNQVPSLTGLIFEPFKEVKKELVPSSPRLSLCRQNFVNDSEVAINLQINVEYNVSYVYHAMYAYFDRDNVALKGLAKFFRKSSEEEREHAEKLMEYQNKRGGRVKLESLGQPNTEFDHPEKGDALHAMEMALCLEKLTNEKLLKLHAVAIQNNDPQLADFVETEFLTEQVNAIKKISEYVAQLRRVGKGHGVWHFDQMLLHEHDETRCSNTLARCRNLTRNLRGFGNRNLLGKESLLVLNGNHGADFSLAENVLSHMNVSEYPKLLRKQIFLQKLLAPVPYHPEDPDTNAMASKFSPDIQQLPTVLRECSTSMAS